MCNGYRFDLLDGVKVERNCTCTCHGSGVRGIRGTSHAQNMVDDPHRFEQARLVGWKLPTRSGHTEEEDYVGPTPEEVGGKTQVRQAEPSSLKVVAGPIRLPSKDANPIFIKAEASLSSGSDLIARRVANSFATWTEVWDSGSGHWFPVNADLIPPLESGTPLTTDEAAKADDGVPRKEP
jgi:hypothetical protein